MPEQPPVPSNDSGDQNLPPSAPQPTPPVPEPARKKRHWLRWTLVGIGCLIVVLAALVVLAPTIASTATVRSFALGMVNKSLNGRVAVDGWKLSWSGPIEASGVRIYDDQNQLILELHEFKTQLGLLDAVRGHYALGDTTIDGLDLVKMDVDANGKTNYEQLVKSKPAGEHHPASAQSGSDRLPSVSGMIKVTNLRGVITAAGAPSPLYIDPSSAEVVIVNIDDPIRNKVDLVMRVGEGKPGTVSLSGTVDAVRDGRIAIDQLSADESLKLDGIDLGALSPLLQMAKVDLATQGLANGAIQLKAAGTKSLAAEGQIKVVGFQAGGGLLHGDTFKTSVLNIPVQVTLDSSDSHAAMLNVKALGVEMDQGKVEVTGGMPVDSLAAVGRLIPAAIAQSLGETASTQSVNWQGGTGRLTLSADFPKLAELVRQLPNTLKLQPGMSLTSAELHHNTTLTLAADHATIATSTKLTNVAGENDGKAISLQPIQVSFDVTAAAEPRPDLRDIQLGLTSGFATIKGGGASLAAMNVDGGFDLKNLQSQAEQFVNLTELLKAEHPVSLAGTGTLSLSTTGNLAKADAPITMNAAVAMRDVRVAGLTEATISQPWLALDVKGSVNRGSASVQGINSVSVTLKSGDSAAPTVDLLATADVRLQPALSIPTFKLVHLNIPNVPKAQQEFAAFLPKGLLFQAGSLAVSAGGSFDGQGIKLTEPLAINGTHLTVVSDKPDATRPILQDQPVALSLACDVKTAPASDTIPASSFADRIQSIQITQLAGQVGGGKDALALLSMPKPITITSPTKNPTAAGSIQVTGDIGRLVALVDALQNSAPGEGLPYRGHYVIEQNISTKGDNISLTGTIAANQFQVLGKDAAGASKVIFSEDQLDVGNNLLLDTVAHNATINNLAVNMKSSGAMSLDVTGKIVDWQSQRKLDGIKAVLKYDLAKLWPIVKPLVLTPEQREQYKQMDMAGTFERTITVSGTYPEGVPFQQAIRGLLVQGGLAIGDFKLPEKGIELQNVDVPFTWREGKLVTLDLTKPQGQQSPPPAAFNSGQLNLGGLTIDLTREHPALTTPPNYPLLTSATLNPIFAESVMNKFLNNPLFADTKESKGLISATVVQCEQFPLDASMQDPSSSGILSVKYSISGLELGNDLITKMVGFLAPNAFNDNSLHGAIKDGTITIRNGVVSHNTPVTIDKYTLDMSGNVVMASGQLRPMNISIPTALFRQKELVAALPQLTIPLTGSAAKPQLDIGRVIQDNLAKGLLGNLLNPQKKAPAAPEGKDDSKGNAQPQANPNPIGDLLDALGGKKDQDKDQPKQDKKKKDKKKGK